MEVVHEASVSGLPKELGFSEKTNALSGGVMKVGVEAAKMYLAAKTGGLSKIIGVDKALDRLLEKGQSPGDLADKFQAIGVERVTESTMSQLLTATYQNGAVFNIVRVCNKADHDTLMSKMPGFKGAFASYSSKYSQMMESISPSVSNSIRAAADSVSKGDYKAMGSIVDSTDRLGTTLDLRNQKKMQAAQKEASRGVKVDAPTPSAPTGHKR